MSTSDPRSRIVLHMNWKGQSLPVLVNGLPPMSAAASNVDYANLPQPNDDQLSIISPLAHVKNDTYRTPTYLIHGKPDDLIPWQQSQEFVEALKMKGVQTGLDVPEGKKHLFDMFRDPDGSGWESVKKGYEFCFKVLNGTG